MKNKTCASVTLEPSRGICHTWSHAGTRLSVKPEPRVLALLFIFRFHHHCWVLTSPHSGSFFHQNESTPVFNQSGQEVVSPTLEQIWCWRIESSVVGWLLSPWVTVKHVRKGFLPTGSPCFKVTLWVLFLRKCLCCQNNQFIDGKGTYHCCPRLLFKLLSVNLIKTMQWSLPTL